MIRLLVRADGSLIGAVEVDSSAEEPEGMVYVGSEGDDTPVRIDVYRQAE